uniref:NADH dehydrogenase subunit 6 n=1 Tax=Unio tumidus TaxID=143298 RepID=A0A1Q1MMP7_9BIVA|nr:NADH dehydrogenase subunit 6 [Unio tumidus]AQM37803.1 NADH dehydrogenase subunit 6 [Unio tumidus]AQM37817.1 NADH dehydrogenase subunit 6 [Unio tumidus]
MTLMLFSSMTIYCLLDSMTSSHPLILSAKVLVLAFSLCLSMSLSTTWYAYMIFMVMLGGVLVMFTYISSLAPNSIFKVKPNILYLSSKIIISLLLTYNFVTISQKALNTQSPLTFPENFITFFLSTSNSSLLLTLASTLLLSMLIMANLLSNSKNAMRSTKLTYLSS